MVGGIIKKIGKQEDRIGICRVSAENEAVLEEPSPMLTHISNIWGDVRYMLRRGGVWWQEGRRGAGWQTRGREEERARPRPARIFPEIQASRFNLSFQNDASMVRCWRCGFSSQWLVEPLTSPTRQKRFSCISNYFQNMSVILLIIHNLQNLAQQIFHKSTFSFFFPPRSRR